MPERQYMLRAIELAMSGAGRVNPNPLVGVVIVKNGRIIGEGYHRQYGDLHAEREALADCLCRGENPAGAEMYVTLEPCCHRGKQPPCTEALVDAKISRIYVGSSDPNPLVAGKGIEYLRVHGVEVQTGYLKSECDSINSIFFHFITKGVPYVALKYAMTADGKIATVTGASKWITGETARSHVHSLRNRYAAIMVGIGTVLKDNPMLNCRIDGGVNPLRIVADSQLRIPLDSNIVKSASGISTIVACAICDADKKAALENCGIEVLEIPDSDKKIDIDKNFFWLIKSSDKVFDIVHINSGFSSNG